MGDWPADEKKTPAAESTTTLMDMGPFDQEQTQQPGASSSSVAPTRKIQNPKSIELRWLLL